MWECIPRESSPSYKGMESSRLLLDKVSDIDITIDGTNGYKGDYNSQDDFSTGAIIGDTAGSAVDSSNTISKLQK